jgi:hypothetical protein
VYVNRCPFKNNFNDPFIGVFASVNVTLEPLTNPDGVSFEMIEFVPASDHFNPVAVAESAINTWELVPTGSRAGVVENVWTSPFVVTDTETGAAAEVHTEPLEVRRFPEVEGVTIGIEAESPVFVPDTEASRGTVRVFEVVPPASVKPTA